MISRPRLYNIVFETDTKEGKLFDVFLLWIILISVFVVILESVPEIGNNFTQFFITIEWILTIIFSIEYFTRIIISPKPFAYIRSFWGIIDLLSILPTYLGLFLVGYHYLIIVRIFRLLRVFRVFKLARYNNEALVLTNALKASMHKITIFFLAIITMVTFMGTLMYVVEGSDKGFSSIPQGIYWAVVTMTTVGYGDLVPHSILGKFISSIAMIAGYAIIAVPTGIITVELSKSNKAKKKCSKCKTNNDNKFKFCTNCGKALETD